MKLPAILLLLVIVGVVTTTTTAFKDLQDGARILLRKSLEENNDQLNRISDSSYSIPLRKAGGGGRVESSLKKSNEEGQRRLEGGLPLGFDIDEFSLLSRMKTMEIPPAADAVNYYSEKYAEFPSSSRFAILRRARRSPKDLKFDDNDKAGTSSSSGPGTKSIPSSPSVSFDGPGDKGPGANPSNKEPTEGDKRFLPELFGLGGGPGLYGHGGHHGYPYYPTGHHGGGYYPHYGGAGYYPGGGLHHGYPGGGYYPGGGGFGNGGSSAAASASSSAGGSGLYRPGIYGGGYYPGNYGNTPILGVGGVPPYGGPGFIGGGFFRDENGKGSGDGKDGSKVSGSIAVIGGGSGGSPPPVSKGGVNFEK